MAVKLFEWKHHHGVAKWLCKTIFNVTVHGQLSMECQLAVGDDRLCADSTKVGRFTIALLFLCHVDFRHDGDDVIGRVFDHFLGQRSFFPVLGFQFVPLGLKHETFLLDL